MFTNNVPMVALLQVASRGSMVKIFSLKTIFLKIMLSLHWKVVSEQSCTAVVNLKCAFFNVFSAVYVLRLLSLHIVWTMFHFFLGAYIPKSTSLTPPCVVSRMLLPLMSRWMVLLVCRCWRPCREDEKKTLIFSSKHLHAVEVFTQEKVVSSTPSSSSSSSTTVYYHKGLVQDVANDAFVHPVPSPQHAFGQICHRASVAELQQQHQRRGGRENISISQHLHLSQHNMAAPRLRTSGTSEICIGASGGEQKKKKKNFLMVRLQKDAQHNSARSAAAYLSPAAQWEVGVVSKERMGVSKEDLI